MQDTTNGRSSRPGATSASLEERPLMTTREVARLFRRTERSIRGWAAKGRLRRVRVGRSVYFRISEVERLLGG